MPTVTVEFSMTFGYFYVSVGSWTYCKVWDVY